MAAETIVASKRSFAPIFFVRSSNKPTRKHGSAEANNSVAKVATVRSLVHRGINAQAMAMMMGTPPMRGTALI